MNKIAQLPQQQRMELFRQTAAQRGMTEQIVEKDFWVCWVLKQLFESPLKDRIIFKGGTSLSKVYGLIERFSEDIDLILEVGATTIRLAHYQQLFFSVFVYHSLLI
mgnify:CR=1 FL=1